MTQRRRLMVAGALALVLVAPACAQKYQAERDGKDAGEAVCDARDADTAEEAAAAIEDYNNEIDNLADDVAIFTAEDRADIDENLTDLQEHINQGNEVLAQQDIAVLRRSLENIRDDLGDTGQAAIDGFFQGLDDCENG